MSDNQSLTFQSGDKLKFADAKGAYTVRAIGKRFAVCTKPLNPQRTVLYTIIDFRDNIRGTENLIFGFGAETDEQCAAMLERLESGETAVGRNRVELMIVDAANIIGTL